MAASSLRRFVIDMYSSRHPLWCMPETEVERVRAALPVDWELVRVQQDADGSGDGVAQLTPVLEDALEGAEVYCGFGLPPGMLRVGRNLRWVHSGAAGVGSALAGDLAQGDVVFTNSAAIHGVPVAEHALALIFYFARGFDRLAPAWIAGRWDREGVSGFDSPVIEVAEATLGIVGCGGIGREVAWRGKALGMRVLATRRSPERGKPEYVDRMYGPEAIRELLAHSDFVVLTVPHTPETDRLIGAAELAAMKEGAVLINVARGRIVDEEALVAALGAGTLRGAGLDVFEKEPLPAGSPFWRLPNVYVTPHVAGISPGFWRRETELILENTSRYLAGDSMLNVVDFEAGY